MTRSPAKGTGILADLLILAAVVGVCAVLFGFVYRYYYRSAYPVKYTHAVEAESKKNGLPASLVYAVIRTESGFDPLAQSSVGARGLMQITEETLDWTAWRLGEEPQPFEVLFDGEANIKYGAALLRLLIDDFGSLENALCAYHAGYGNASRWLDDPKHSPDGENVENIPFGDTARYVKKVKETQRIYERLYNIN